MRNTYHSCANEILKHIASRPPKTLLVILFSILYLSGMSILSGFTLVHRILVGFFNLCCFSNYKTRKVILALAVYMVLAFFLNMIKLYPHYLLNRLDYKSLYHFGEKAFDFSINSQMVKPTVFFAHHHNIFPDILSDALYHINWMLVPLALALWLYMRNKQLFEHFSLPFLWLNIIGLCVSCIHTAARLRYASLYGFEIHMNAPGNTARLARLDELLHIPDFNSIYVRNSIVFTIMKSLLFTYPAVAFFYALKIKTSLRV